MGFLLKIAVFGVVAYIAWTTARRWLGLSNPPAQAPAPPQREAATPQRRPVVEDTRLCTVCGAYVSASSGRCGRSDCPQA
ncbi:MAG TPA: hypothetical protein VKY24_15440 [Reyranella sp.]|nr:hypothetical protein [Reyranella sp.]